VRGRVTIRIERCKGCEFCIEFCPQGVLETSTDFNPKGYHYPVVVKDECINCTSCLTLCPDYAIFSNPKPAAKKLPAKPTKSNRGSKSRELRSAK
jgi:2-oxoglutarate ferredoxin oxidoreductase subunit delta